MISNLEMRRIYAGNDSTSTPYVIDFPFEESNDLIVHKREISSDLETAMAEVTDYLVAGTDLTTVVALPSTYQLVIYRRTDSDQPVDYTIAGSFPAESHEAALDHLALLSVEHRDEVGHAFRIPLTREPLAEMATYEPNSVVGLDADGNPRTQSASELLSWINLSIPIGNWPTKTWLNDSERALAVPDFVGQLGYQRDTTVPYGGTALSAGSWTVTDLPRSFANAAARTAATPHYVGQFARQVDTNGLYYGTALSAGSWAELSTGVTTSFDFLSPLTAAEIAITGAATATIGRAHRCTGASYTLALPAVAANAGKSLSLIMDSALTGRVTVDGNASETINGSLTRVMWANEWVDLYCTGTKWEKRGGLTIPMMTRLRRTSVQSIPNDSSTKIAFNAESYDVGGIGDFTTNDRVNILRAGIYHVSGKAMIEGVLDAGERMRLYVTKNGTTEEMWNEVIAHNASQDVFVEVTDILQLAAGDFLELIIEQTEGSAQDTSTDNEMQPTLAVAEIPQW